MVKKLHFHIGVDGVVQLKVEGVSGPTCETFSAPFEKVLGKVDQRTYHDTYYQDHESGQQQEEKSGC